MPPNELESYAVTLVKACLRAKELRADTSDADRAKAHKAQAERLTALVEFLLDHYELSGYSGRALGIALIQRLRKWVLDHMTTPPKS